MDTKKLRQKILDLAIRGKLVPQDPNDEPASILIEKIRAEKERLIKEKKIKRDKNESYIYRSDKSYYEKFADGTVKCIDEEIPFEIPESWEWCRLGGIGSWSAGATPNRNNKMYYSDGGIPWLKTGDLNDGIITHIPECITEKALKECSVRLNPIGSVLIAMYGATIGKLGILTIESATNQACCACIPYDGIINEYLFYYLLSQKEFLQNKAEGGAQPNISKDKIINTLIAIPSFERQKLIVSQIKELLSIIDNIDNDRSNIRSVVYRAKSKILDLAIRGKLVPQDPNDEPASVLLERIKAEHPESKKKTYKTSDNSHYTFDIPPTWVWTTIGDIAEHNTGKTLDKSRNTGILHKYITTSNLYWDSFVSDNLNEMPIEEHELSRYSAIKGDLLICEGGDGGRSAIWNKEHSICFQNHIHRVRPFCDIKSKYIYFFMLYSSLNGYLNYYKKGIGIQSLSGTSLSSIRLPLPPLTEQNRIVKKIEEIFSSLDEIANSIKA